MYPEQLGMYPKMKHKVDRYVSIVNVVLFTKKNECVLFTVLHLSRGDIMRDHHEKEFTQTEKQPM